MSRRFQKVLTNAFHVSFLETIENDPCERSYSLTISIQHDDISLFGKSVFVKLCHSQEECEHYEIGLDAYGKGSITIEELSANTVNVVLLDEDGSQAINGDLASIVYEVNGERQEEDYARLFTEDGASEYHIHIQCATLSAANLTIMQKVMWKNEIKDPSEDECFLISMEGQGISRTLSLDASNGFACCMEDIPHGNYMIRLLDDMGDTIYEFDGERMYDGQIEVGNGDHTLLMMHSADYDTSLILRKFIRNEKGELCPPQRLDCFQVRVISDRQDIVVTLDEQNDFCLQLKGILPGYYRVIEELNDYDTSYIVNNACERSYANLEITECGENEVLIINSYGCFDSLPPQDSQLRITKLIKTRDGNLCKPCNGEVFQVSIQGCGMCQTLNLKEDNNYTVDIASLCSGYYTIEEIGCHDYESSYIVNQDRERTSACLKITETSNDCVTIVNSKRNTGSLRVCSYQRNDYGELIKPDKRECFDMTLSSFFCKECFTLSAQNDWCMCFDDLRLGSYEVKQQNMDGYQIEYQVDCGQLKAHARFMMDGCDREVKVIHFVPKCHCGTLKICKYEETQSGEFVKPQRDEQFHVLVEGMNFSECYVLKASNNWCVLLDGLEAGEYHIQEEEGEYFDVCYLVNGCRKEEACVVLTENNQAVTILNHRRRSGILEIDASVQNCDGDMDLPFEGMDIDVLVEGKENCYHVCLNEDNNWCVLLDQLPEDTYRIIQKDNFGFGIRYQVDGVDQDFARIAMNREDHHVSIINEMQACSGMVKVSKYVEDEYGNLQMPCSEDSYRFELKGSGCCQTYTLCARNDFCVYFDDLTQGHYEIKELDAGKNTRYLCNRQPFEKACFTLGKEDIYIDIINRFDEETLGITVEKKIRQGDHLCRPCEDDCFKVLLTGRNTYEIFELNDENDFCVTLGNLRNQHYEIKELSRNAKTYLLNGCKQENGYFLFEGKPLEMVIINEEEQTGALRLEKLMEDDCGNYVRPQRFESFDIMIEGDCFKRKVTLDSRNNFCVCLYDIPCGHYQIKECESEYEVSYMIHDMPCEKAIIDLYEEDVNVTVVNHPIRLGSLHFEGYVERDGVLVPSDPMDEFVLIAQGCDVSKSIVLHAGNDFCGNVCELKKGRYTITESGKDDVVFVYDQQRFADTFSIDIDGGCTDIDVVKVKKKASSITIRKWMMEEDGTKKKPGNDDHFIITLLYQGKKQMFELNQNNHFTKYLQQPQPGKYQVLEESGNARYVMNGEAKEDGCFTLKDEDMVIDVLNEAEMMGTLMLQMLEQTCEESLIPPKDSTMYEVELLHDNDVQTLVFQKENQWKIKKKLPYGNYQLRVNHDQEVYFFMDHSKTNDANFTLQHRQMVVQAIIKQPCQTGSILIQKFIRSMDCGCFKRPLEKEYEIEVKGESYHRVFYLHQGNQYQQLLEEIPDGTYEIREVDGEASYIVNGGMEETQASVVVAGNKNVVKIINDSKTKATGSIEICKLMKDEEGCYCYPKGEDAFWITLKGEQESNRVLLNEANHFYASMRNLKDGWYEVMEESGGNEVRYVVNNGTPMKKGVVHVMGNANTVNVINAMPHTQGSIHLQKWVVSQGEETMPLQGEYRIQIQQGEEQQIINLNQNNQYQAKIEHLEGTYVIKELDHEHVRYRVDQESERDVAVVEVQGRNHHVDILNQMQNSGRISLVKYKRVQHQLQRPQGSDMYEFYLTAPNYQKMIRLDQGNHWQMVIDHLAPATYELSEQNASNHVSYIIDAQNEVDQAVIEVNQGMHQVTIINSEEEANTGMLHIEKMVRQNDMLRKPDRNQRYQIQVSKPGFQQRYTLQEANDFHLTISNLEKGTYLIEELMETGMVSFVIDGGLETSDGHVQVNQNEVSVQIINTSIVPNQGSIHVEKMIRRNNQLSKPTKDQSFQLHVSKPGFNEQYTLNAGNDFQITLQHLEDGFYVLDEPQEQGDVSYIINGQSETNYGIVEVKGNENQVQMINTQVMVQGSIFFSKYIKNADGSSSIPADGDVYTLEVYNESFMQRVTLRSQNNFQSVLSGLAEGVYHFRELDSSNFRVTYRINGSEETSEGIVYVQGTGRNMVDVYNERVANLNTVDVFKYMLDKDDNYLPPSSPDVYQFEITAPGFRKTYDLTPENSWHVVITDLSSGTYQITEITQDPQQVRYLINSAQLQEKAIINAQPGMNNIVGIINLLDGVEQGQMTLTKKMRDAQGQLVTPQPEESFVMQVSGTHFDRLVALDQDNDFTSTITNLAYGVYTIEERDRNYDVSFRVNGGRELPEGIVEITNPNNNDVIIINTESEIFYDVNQNESVKIVIE